MRTLFCYFLSLFLIHSFSGCGAESDSQATNPGTLSTLAPQTPINTQTPPAHPPHAPDPDSGYTAEMANQPASGRIVAAEIKSLGQIRPEVEQLAKKFKDGGSVVKFVVKRLEEGFFLVRMGKNSVGENYSEAFPLIQRGEEFFFGDLSRTLTCRSKTCSDCYPDMEGKGCLCLGKEETCSFAEGPGYAAEELFE